MIKELRAKKIFLFILTVTMIFICVFFIACGDAETGSGNKSAKNDDGVATENIGGDSSNNGDKAEGEAVAETPKILPDLPERDFEGYEFTILGNSEEYHAHWYSRDLYAAEQNGDTINDAIYMRNTKVEDDYNIKINAVYASDPIGAARKNIMSGDGVYDLLSIQLEGTGRTLAQNSLLHDWNEVPCVDLDRPWWDQNAREHLSICGKLFMTMGDMTIVDKDAVFVYLFNKDLIADLVLENPYALVRNNKWTVDKLYEMSKAATSDMNGDGVIDDKDRFGNLSENNSFYESVLAAGEPFVKKDGGNIPYVNVDNQRLIQSVQKWIVFQLDTSATMMANDYGALYPGDLIWDKQLDMLNTKMALFLFTGMNRVTMLREMECNFGIIPMPKLDEQQENFSNPLHTWCATTLSIPNTVEDIERSGIITEALTAESYYTLKPAYYDVSLKTKLARDDESGEMMDLIFANRTYDLGKIYNWGRIYEAVKGLADNKKTDYVSSIDKIKLRMQTDLEKTIEVFQNK